MSTPYSLTATVSETRHGAAVEILNAGLISAGHNKKVSSVEEYVAFEAQAEAEYEPFASADSGDDEPLDLPF